MDSPVMAIPYFYGIVKIFGVVWQSMFAPV